METLNKIIAMINEYINKKRFGKIEISFESGKIVNIKIMESIKP